MLARQFDAGNSAVGVVMALACEHVKPGRLYFAIGLGAFVAVDKQVFAIAIEKIENPPVFYIADVITDDLQAPPQFTGKRLRVLQAGKLLETANNSHILFRPLRARRRQSSMFHASVESGSWLSIWISNRLPD
jgi:hypothetical protein